MANVLQGSGQKVDTVIPVEGVTGWADTSMIAADATNLNCAYKWIEHSLSSNLQSDLSVWFGGIPVVPAACSNGSGMQTPEGCVGNQSENFDKIRFWTTPTSKCAQGECVPYYRWVSDYIGVIGGR